MTPGTTSKKHKLILIYRLRTILVSYKNSEFVQDEYCMFSHNCSYYRDFIVLDTFQLHVCIVLCSVTDVSPCTSIFVSRSLIFMFFLTMFGTGFGAYIMTMAALSPCPLLVHSESGTVVIVRLNTSNELGRKTVFLLDCEIY